jgi:murein DD-endopeptidase MepM/ murein hydrolase activator NlpD/LysM repeat protein
MDTTPGRRSSCRNEGALGSRSLRPLLIALLVLGSLALSRPAMAQRVAVGSGCPLPRELGAGTWFLASMASVDLCDLLRAPEPQPVAQATPQTTPAATRTPPQEHIVVEDETLSVIALQYGLTVEALMAFNGLEDADALAIGMVLRLVGDEGDIVNETPLPGANNVALRTLTACHPDVLERPLDLAFDPIRIAAQRGVLYMLAGGQLYALPESDLDLPAPTRPMAIMPRDMQVDSIPVQELMDLAVNDATGELMLLDKTGDLFAYQPSSSRWRVHMVAQRLPDVWLDPQFLTIAVLDGVVYGLDVDGARLWRMDTNLGRPVIAREQGLLAGAVDLAAMDGRLYLLNTDGTLSDIQGTPFRRDIEWLRWAADLNAVGDSLLAVDADGRRVVLLDDDSILDITLAIPGMQRLRSATLSGRTVYAVAGPKLYRFDLDGATRTCPPAPYDDRWLFHGLDLRASLPTFQLPYRGGVLPNRPRSYPGARRLYRFGIHEGVDFYQGDAPGLAYGSPVASIGDGVVVRIDHGFREMTPAEYVVVMNEIYALHSTPDHSLDKLRGQQVWVEHAPGIISRYAHLASVASDLQVGDQVVAGQRLGTTGVSGTSSGVYRRTDGYHLHWEIWLHDRYLGYGLTLRETMRLWRRIF